jgi:hypothetical protein
LFTVYVPLQGAGNRVLAPSTKGTVIRNTTAGAGTAQQSAAVKSNTTQTKQIAIAAAPAATTQQKGTADSPQSPTKSPQQHVMIRQQVVQKVAAQPGTVVVSGGQMFAPGQIVVSGNQVVGTPTQVSFMNILLFLRCFECCACVCVCVCVRERGGREGGREMVGGSRNLYSEELH